MDDSMKQSLRRLIAQLTPEGMDEIQLQMKVDIMNQLQGAMSPEDAFKFKLELDASDNFFLRLKNIAESTPVLVDI